MILWLLHKVGILVLITLNIVPGLIHIFKDDGSALSIAGMKNYVKAPQEIQFFLAIIGIYQFFEGLIFAAEFFELIQIAPYLLWF